MKVMVRVLTSGICLTFPSYPLGSVTLLFGTDSERDLPRRPATLPAMTRCAPITIPLFPSTSLHVTQMRHKSLMTWIPAYYLSSQATHYDVEDRRYANRYPRTGAFMSLLPGLRKTMYKGATARQNRKAW
ncbi:hypothetical protein GGR50DRAFT_178900 [Xylaria sp. CBS 124048]|nr:hypothetical protein GGR50DRAFT_178900 [Xylaria sp. CBS 124048]